MRRFDLPAAAAICLLCTGCIFHHGIQSDEVAGMVSPRGSPVRVQLKRTDGRPQQTIMGELLEVRDSALVVLSDGIVLAGFAEIGRITVDGPLPGLDQRETEQRARGRPGPYLRPLSRYPQGLTPEVLEALLQQHGQTEPRRLVP